MHVVITGGAGFIGSHLTIYLKERGYKVTCIDNLSRATKSTIKTLEKEKIPLIITDIRETNKLLEIFKGAYVVIHAAALISVEESIKDPSLYLDNNAIGTVSVTKACIDASVRRLIYLSSAAVYGEPIKLPIVKFIQQTLYHHTVSANYSVKKSSRHSHDYIHLTTLS